MEYEPLVKRYVCRFCKGSFDQAENLYKHVQQIHTVRSTTKESRTCLLCGVQNLKSEDYRNHLRHIHSLNEEGQAFSFKCFNDFLLWKNETEKRNYCKFVMRTVPKVLSSNDKVHIYQCDSSGSKTKDKKGFVAVKDTCPAMISAIESAKTRGIKVEYWNSHIGHPVPVEDDELDAAINSLQVPEVVLGDDQRFQNDSGSNIFLLTESNEGSLSDSVGNETPKAKKSLFMKNNNNSTSEQSKPELHKFPFRKDPSKKIPSFHNSLASVACMKPKPKPPKVDESIVSVTTTVETISDSSTVFTASTIEPPSEPEEYTAVENSPEEDATTIIKLKSPTKSQEKEPDPESTQPPSAKSSSSATQSPNLSLISDGVASGQYIILNSVPGENGVQNLLLCPVGPKAPTSNASTSSSKQSEENAVIIISPTGEITAEKENTSSVQNVLTLKPNTPLPTGVGKSFLPSGKSLLKQQKLKNAQSKKLEKSFTSSPNKLHLQQGSLSNSINLLSATNRPANFFPVLGSSLGQPRFLSSASVIANKPGAKPSIGSPLGPDVSVSTRLVNSSVCSPLVGQPLLQTGQTLLQPGQTLLQPGQALLQPGQALLQPGQALLQPGQTLLQPGQTLLQPGQTFMSFNNNLIPIGNGGFISPNLNSGFIIPASSPLVKNPQSSVPQPSMTLGAPTTTNASSVSQLTSSIGKALPPNAMPIILLPSNESLASIPSSSGNPVASNASATTAATSSAASMPLIVSTVQSIAAPQVLSSNQYLSSIFPPGSQPTPVRPGKSQLISKILSDSSRAQRPPMPKFLSSTVPKTPTSVSQKTATSASPKMPTSVSPKTPTTVPPKTPTTVPPKTPTTVPPKMPSVPPKTLAASPRAIPPRPRTSSIALRPRTALISTRPIVSTTVSNTVQIQRMPTPMFSNVRNNICFTSTPIVSQTNSPIVVNTEPISSAPAINIPAINVGDKSGTIYLKSPNGGVYMLEPVDDSSVETAPVISSSDTAKRKEKLILPAQDKVNLPDTKDDSSTKASVPEEKSSTLEQDKMTISDVNSSEDDSTAISTAPVQSHLEIKVDHKLKTPSPKKSPEFRNSVQIKSVVQEKRPFKEDDVEILKKVKYYQMEMKYLSSQAECKRLKLELAKAKMKNEALVNQEDIVISNVESKKDAALSEKKTKVTRCDKFNSILCKDSASKENMDVGDVVDIIVKDIVAKVAGDAEDEESMDVDFVQGDASCQSSDDEMDQTGEQGFESEVESVADDKLMQASPELNKSLEVTGFAKKVVDPNNLNTEEKVMDEEPLTDLQEEEGMSAESLKSLEEKYGNQSSLNIYTMIRTSVLRSLYEDMKSLCEENKKLFEELQNYRAHDQLFEILGEQLHEEL